MESFALDSSVILARVGRPDVGVTDASTHVDMRPLLRLLPLPVVASVLLQLIGACAAPPSIDVGKEEAPVKQEPGATTTQASPVTCDANATSAPLTLLASAPLGISENHLGRPVDASFESFAGETGASLFPKSKVTKQGLHRMEHAMMTMDSKRGKEANIDVGAKLWGGSASVGKDNESRFASYRASQLVEFREIDDTTEIRSDGPKGAVWYIARIFYGRSFELVLHGEKSRFNASVKARYKIAKGGVKTFAEQNGLSVAAQGRGLEPVDGEAIFAQGEEEISKAYKQSGDPVPVAVEYRSIPRSCVPADEAIEWVAPWRARVTFDSIDVYRHGDSNWNLEARCMVNDRLLQLDNPIIWSARTGVGSQCTRGALGPQGDADFCPYKLYWSEGIELVEGDRLRCGLTGTIGSGQGARTIVKSEFNEVVTKGMTQKATTFGDGDGSVEYRVHYAIAPGG
jgi:hypothetical protein